MNKHYSTEKFLHHTINSFYPDIVLLSSFGSPEAAVLLHMVCASQYKRVPIVTLDTGRLPEETFHYIDRIRNKYDVNVDVLFPNPCAVQKMVTEKGPNLFYDSVENRKECCGVRKVDVFDRYTKANNVRAYISGLRREHSIERAKAHMIERKMDPMKINPLIDWSTKDVWDYVEIHKIPVHSLNLKSYPSVGCAPCTRAVTIKGADPRSGRWWWEHEDAPKECGLHGFFDQGSGI